MAEQGHSLSALEIEKEELQKDLLAFMTSYDLIRRRLIETSEEHPSRAAGLESWTGTWACIGSLGLASEHIEKNILEIDELIKKVKSGEIPNRDKNGKKRGLEIVKEEGT